jgi:N-acetylmuramoyl-L-alanine amidase
MSMARHLATVILFCFATASFAQGEINGVRMWPAPDNTRVVFDADSQVEHSLFTLKNPDRLVIDIKDTSLKADLTSLDYDKTVLSDIRTGKHGKSGLRVVLDLKQKVQPKSFVLRPNEKYGHRLVIDLNHADETAATKKKSSIRTIEQARSRAREVVIAIDPGHGGEDPGASGWNRTHEKDVVLAIGRKLEALLKKEPGFKPVLIRKGDYFINLKKRVKLAREANADLMISIHADSFRDRRAKGATVYTLSLSDASSEQAKIVADKENSSDLIGGVSLDDKDDMVASVILDLSQTASMEISTDVAGRVLSGLRGVGPLHRKKVEHAGFRVLKAPDIPSILVETAFISNPKQERQLRSSAHQNKMAKAILRGIRGYFVKYPPPGTILAQAKRKHIISRGDTLSGIARQYSVSLDLLKNTNNLRSTQLRIGQVLRIPSGS